MEVFAQRAWASPDLNTDAERAEDSDEQLDLDHLDRNGLDDRPLLVDVVDEKLLAALTDLAHPDRPRRVSQSAVDLAELGSWGQRCQAGISRRVSSLKSRSNGGSVSQARREGREDSRSLRAFGGSALEVRGLA